MATTFDKNIILSGAPFAWLHTINEGTITEKWRFDNLQNSTYKLTKPGTDTGGENIDIQRADGVIIRFPKTSKILSGKDETDITPADASSDATGKGEITIVTNEAPLNATSYPEFINELRANMDKFWMITIGTGYSYANSISASRKPNGYIHMIGKINTDIEQTLDSNPSSLSITFVAYTNSGLEEADLTAATFTAITLKLGGTGKDKTGIAPAAIDATGADIILSGDLLIVPTT
jgi:hypothetical protein